MRLSFLLLMTPAIITASCGQTTKPAETKNVSVPVPVAAPVTNLGKEGTDNLMSVVSNYYELKNALVATNAAKADEAASLLLSASENMNYKLQQSPEAFKVMHPYLDTLMQKSEALVNIKDTTCEQKRLVFSKISDVLFVALKKANMQHGGVYQEFCPMAFDSKGAHWLSNESEIKNPYFGKKMLDCGEVQDSL